MHFIPCQEPYLQPLQSPSSTLAAILYNLLIVIRPTEEVSCDREAQKKNLCPLFFFQHKQPSPLSSSSSSSRHCWVSSQPLLLCASSASRTQPSPVHCPSLSLQATNFRRSSPCHDPLSHLQYTLVY